ncbi:protein FAR1-RELATED SEQUENCE 6-like [Dioscorea cayenensis subsp. rotundata]|uniref:Protein FAR1-RELATED SEQUENCE n=1 Tax=Dioscorea cayennensis subsp. rotundata TaxID=55577 RepID=A0AB40CVK4_DIOCR|nr:protein FAR1-RELATED SEQUENCE 6-like [Dioscorea cayenensis subsp. rotundata]
MRLAQKKILKRITYEAVDTQEFEDTYLKMMEDYNIKSNEWLNSLFKIRDRWAPVYVRVCSFQVSDVVKGKEGAFRKQVVYNVYTNEEEFDIKCSCQLFEFRGIICRHICKVLIEKNVNDIPSRYILPRWTKDIKRMHTYIQNCYDDPQTNEEKLRYNKLCSHFTKAAELGAESNDKYMFLMNYVDEAIGKLMDNTCSNEKFKPMLSEETNVPHQKFLSPLKVNSNSISINLDMHHSSSLGFASQCNDL